MAEYKHILFATDLTDECHKTVAIKAQHLAKLYGAKLSLVHSIEPLPAYGYEGLTDIESPYIDHAKEAMENIAKELQITDDDREIVFGPTKRTIPEHAGTIDADLIIVGSHGRSGITLLLGSTAQAILNKSPCDVLVVRMEGHKHLTQQ